MYIIHIIYVYLYMYTKLYMIFRSFVRIYGFTIKTRITFIYIILRDSSVCKHYVYVSARELDTIHSACRLVHERIESMDINRLPYLAPFAPPSFVSPFRGMHLLIRFRVAHRELYAVL